MLLDEIKKQMFAAMKAGRTVEKEVLRVAVGELTMAEARSGKALSDEEAAAVVKKLVKSNEETLSVLTDAAKRVEIEEELTVLRSFLPKALDASAIAALLAPVVDSIRGAKNDGQATGVAMKHLKGVGADVDGKVVSSAVAQIRSTNTL